MKNISFKRFIILFMVILIALVGCSTDDNSQPKDQDMVTITDVKGEVKIPKNPKRVVDLSGNSDILSILGYKVIGTANSDAYDYSKFPTYLEDILKGATILGYSMQDTMDVEKIMSLDPDLIIISNVQEKMYEQLSSVAPTVMVALEALDWKEDIKTLAKIFDKNDEAKKWLEDYESKVLEKKEEIEKAYGKDTTYLSFLASGGQFYVFDQAGFGDVLYNDLKLKKPENMPTQTDISLPVVTYEGLAAIESDYLFVLATDEDLEALTTNPIWKKLPQVENNKVVFLKASPYFNQGYSSIGKELLLDEILGLLDEAK